MCELGQWAAPRARAVPGGDAGAVPRRALEVRGEPLLPQLHAARGAVAKTRTVTEKDVGAAAETHPPTELPTRTRTCSTPRRKRRNEEALERGEEDEKISEPVARHVGSRRGGRALLERDENDLVGIKHNRRIVSFVAGDVETLTLDTQSRVSSVSPSCASRCAATRSCCTRFARWSPPPSPCALGHYPRS